MAVTKIHKTSRMTLLVAGIVSLLVMALFYLGGQVPEEQKIVAGMPQPKFTDIVLYWSYILLAITIVVLIGFAIVGFLKNLKESPKKALGGLFMLLGLVGLLLITYLIGNGSLLNIPGYEGPDNNPGTLKMTDMWLYSCYFMLGITFIAILFMPLFSKKK